MRYTYRGDKLTDSKIKGMQCNPVKRADGKCVTSKMATMLVVDEQGNRHVVLRRQLRVNK